MCCTLLQLWACLLSVLGSEWSVHYGWRIFWTMIFCFFYCPHNRYPRQQHRLLRLHQSRFPKISKMLDKCRHVIFAILFFKVCATLYILYKQNMRKISLHPQNRIFSFSSFSFPSYLRYVLFASFPSSFFALPVHNHHLLPIKNNFHLIF